MLSRALFHADNCYLLPAVAIWGDVCRTHVTSHTAFRGFGGPQGMLVIEDILDRIARTLTLAPHLVRERNFYRDGRRDALRPDGKDADRIERIWGELKDSSHFDARGARSPASTPRALTTSAASRSPP